MNNKRKQLAIHYMHTYSISRHLTVSYTNWLIFIIVLTFNGKLLFLHYI